jgi:peptidoglycan LD-endopeptidase LytH
MKKRLALATSAFLVLSAWSWQSGGLAKLSRKIDEVQRNSPAAKNRNLVAAGTPELKSEAQSREEQEEATIRAPEPVHMSPKLPSGFAPLLTDVPIDGVDHGPLIAELRNKNLQIPVAGFDIDNLKGSFTQKRGEDRLHNAADFQAPKGTPVLAVEDGVIARVHTSKAGGLTLYQTDPSARFVYYYAHLDGYVDGMEQGKSVKKGDVIGYVGFTGNASPIAPHLHFAIWQTTPDRIWGGVPIDPYEVFKK